MNSELEPRSRILTEAEENKISDKLDTWVRDDTHHEPMDSSSRGLSNPFPHGC